MSINNLNTYLNVRDAHLRVVSGNVYAQAMNIGGINVETAHGLQSVSDTGNVTSNTLQFSNATTGFVTTANAQIGRDLVVTGNATVSTDLTVSANATVTDTLTISEHLIASKEATITGNLHVTTIRSDSNVVAEYTGPHDRPLRKYPEVGFPTQANGDIGNTTVTYKGYTLTSSTTYNYINHNLTNALDGLTNTTWSGNLGNYTTAGVPESTTRGGLGDYVQLELPNAIKIQHTKIFSQETAGYSNGPRDITLYGSNNGTDWTSIKVATDLPLNGEALNTTVHVNSITFYRYFRLEINKIWIDSGNATYPRIAEWELYGYEEGSGSLDTTLKTVYNVPATTGTQLEVYYDAKNYTSGTITDESPNSYVGTLNGNAQLETVDGIKAFTFDGNGDTITGTISGASGEYVHSIVFWVKFEDLVATANQGYTLFEMGPRAEDEMIGLYAESDMINYYFYSNDNSYVLNGVSFGNLVNNQWYQIAATYSGGSDISNRKIYINGNEIARTTHGGASSGPLSLTNGNFTIGDISGGGGSNDLKGSIANFRIYSKALNADQIKELYDYQKDYFLGSKSQVTLYKGHLGVGVTEPSGQLELAGDERIQEYPPMAMTGWETYMEGHGVFRAGKSGHDAYLGTWDRWKVFNKGFTASGGTTGDAYHGEQSYSSSTGLYTGSESLGGISGDYFILDMPYKISLKHINVTSANQNRSPTEFIILGSNNGSTWTQIKSFSSSFTSAGQTLPFQVNSTEYFSYFGLVVTKIVASDGYFMLSEWQLFGTPDSTTLDKGSLTLGRSLDVPRVSRYDVDTETPRPERIVLDYDTTVNSSPTDISGKGNYAVFRGNSEYSAADRAFKFDGQGASYIYGSNLSGLPTGNAIYSLVGWINVKPSLSVTATVIVYGSHWGVSTIANLSVNTSYQVMAGIGGDHIKSTNAVITPNTWHHVAAVKNQSTGVCTVDTIDLYVDGILITDKTYVGISRTQNIGSTTYVGVGGGFTGAASDACNGLVSNPKIYSVALESSEIRKLYNLGRTGWSMVISDTAVGIGRAPEAQLDVRGVIRGPGLSIQTVSSTKTDTSFFSGTSITDIGGLSITIQPKFANSKIYVGYYILYGGWGRNFFRLKRTQGSSTTYFRSDLGPRDHASTSRATTTDAFGNDDASTRSGSFFTLDDANGLEPITYTVQGWTYHGTYYVCVNRGYNEGAAGNETYRGRGISSISAQEVCQ